MWTQDGRLIEEQESQYIVRATGWNVGVTLEERSSGGINLLISRSNHQIMTDANCVVDFKRGSWTQTTMVDITATMAPKITLEKPGGDQNQPLNATFYCDAPWDQDDDQTDDSDQLVLAQEPGAGAIESLDLYAIGAGLFIVAAAWLSGLIRPSSSSRLPEKRKPRAKAAKPKRHTPKETETPSEEVSEDISISSYEEEAVATETAKQSVDNVSEEAQESLIEIEEEPEEDLSELDEFELRLRRLQKTRRGR